jgi:hypothetical protein
MQDAHADVARGRALASRKRGTAWLDALLDCEGGYLLLADVHFRGTAHGRALLGPIPVALIYWFFVEQYATGLAAVAVEG